MFLDIEGVVGILDGKKFLTLQPEDSLQQNRDYNRWIGDVNRNLVLLCGIHAEKSLMLMLMACSRVRWTKIRNFNSNFPVALN